MDQTMRGPLRVIWKRRLFILLIAAAMMAGSLWNSAGKPKLYVATTELLIRPVAPSAAFFTFHSGSEEGPLGLDLPTNSLAELISSEVVASRVVEDLRLDVSPKALARAVSAKAVGESFITVTISWTNAELVAQLADAFAREFIEYRREQAKTVARTAHDDLTKAASRFEDRVDTLDEAIRILAGDLAALPNPLPEVKANVNEVPTTVQQIPPAVANAARFRASVEAAKERKEKERDESLARLQLIRANAADLQLIKVLETGSGDITQTAIVPRSATSPNPPRDAVVGLILGLFLAIGFVLMRHYLSRKIKTRDDVARAVMAPVLGAIPEGRRWRGRREAYLVSMRQPASEQADAYRALRANLVARGVGSSIRRVLVTSVSDKEGKTTTVANLAVAFAKSGLRTMAVSADFNSPRLQMFFGVPNEPGLSSVLEGNANLARALVGTEVANLVVLPSGSVDAKSGDLLGSHTLEDVMTEAESYADVILIDTAAVTVSSAAQSMAAVSDGSVLVVEAGAVDSSSVMRAVGQLQQAGAAPIGVVLNRALDEDDTAGIVEARESLAGYEMGNGNRARRSAGVGAGQLVDMDFEDVTREIGSPRPPR